MSKGEFLYVKGMNISDSEDEHDIWDDRQLNAAYDNALRIANAEVAKRIALATNSHQNDKDCAKAKKEKPLCNGTKSAHQKGTTVGSFCRAIYEGNGLEYEAVIITVINEEECVIKFLGYDNTEIVPISTLKPSCGKQAQAMQIEQAIKEKMENEPTTAYNENRMDYSSDRVPSPGSTEKSFPKKKKSSKKKHHRNSNSFELPEIPSQLPNLGMFRNGMNLGAMEIPIPPPPVTGLPTIDRLDSEDQALSTMLLSWYMNGYYTGLYQGMKRAREMRKHQ